MTNLRPPPQMTKLRPPKNATPPKNKNIIATPKIVIIAIVPQPFRSRSRFTSLPNLGLYGVAACILLPLEYKTTTLGAWDVPLLAAWTGLCWGSGSGSGAALGLGSGEGSEQAWDTNKNTENTPKRSFNLCVCGRDRIWNTIILWIIIGLHHQFKRYNLHRQDFPL